MLQPIKVSEPQRTRSVARISAEKRSLDGPNPPDGRDYPIIMLDNGLVSMETTPDYLIPVAQENAKSHLLRMPPEIRTIIFRYAMGGSKIRIQEARTHLTSKTWRKPSKSIRHGRATHLSKRELSSEGTAFHLPEVCRQMYADTAILGYATNTFQIGSIREEVATSWLSQRNAAQLLAITSVQPGMWNVFSYLTTSSNRSYLKHVPSLQFLHIAREIEESRWLRSFQSAEAFREFVINKVKEKEGESVGVVFWDTRE